MKFIQYQKQDKSFGVLNFENIEFVESYSEVVVLDNNNTWVEFCEFVMISGNRVKTYISLTDFKSMTKTKGFYEN